MTVCEGPALKILLIATFRIQVESHKILKKNVYEKAECLVSHHNWKVENILAPSVMFLYYCCCGFI